MTADEIAAAIADMGLRETSPMDLVASGATNEARRLRVMADAVSGHLMMAESHLVKGEVTKAHEWLVKARFALAAEIGR